MPFRPHINDLKPYVAQAPVERLRHELGLDQIYKMASNEGAFGPVPAARAVISGDPDRLRRYPDSAAPELREALAARFGLSPENVVLGNGADELIRLAGLAVLEPGDNGVLFWPSFPTYVAACAANGAQARQVPLRDDWTGSLEQLSSEIDSDTRIVFLANPNNPTGLLLPRAELSDFLDRLPERVLCVLDEAYAEYAEGDDEPDGAQLIREGRENLIVLRTFSKIYGLAGLRIGYALGSPNVIAALDRLRNIFNVNIVAQEAALASLPDDAEVERRVTHVKGARTQIFKWLALSGHRPIASRANFVFVVTADGDGPAFADRLLRLGVAVRALDGFGAPEAIRVTCGSDEENQYFAAALDRIATGMA